MNANILNTKGVSMWTFTRNIADVIYQLNHKNKRSYNKEISNLEIIKRLFIVGKYFEVKTKIYIILNYPGVSSFPK